MSSNVLSVYVDSTSDFSIGTRVKFAGLTLTPLATLLNGSTQTVASIGLGGGYFTVNPFVASDFPLGSTSDAETGTVVLACPLPIALIAAPAQGGWSTVQLIELADRRTERRGSKTLDLQAEFMMALQIFCMEKRWYWRKKWATMTIHAGIWQYDISQPATNCGPEMSDFQQFSKHGVRIYPNPGNPQQWGELTPLFERDQQSAAIYSNTYAPRPQPPQQYFMNPHLILNIVPLPDRDYPITLDYWAVAGMNPLPDTQIPLLPAFMHPVLLKLLEAQIFRYTLGEGAAKYQAAIGEYMAMVARYSGMDGMVPGEHIDWSAEDDYESTFANAQSAVQSTR